MDSFLVNKALNRDRRVRKLSRCVLIDVNETRAVR